MFTLNGSLKTPSPFYSNDRPPALEPAVQIEPEVEADLRTGMAVAKMIAESTANAELFRSDNPPLISMPRFAFPGDLPRAYSSPAARFFPAREERTQSRVKARRVRADLARLGHRSHVAPLLMEGSGRALTETHAARRMNSVGAPGSGSRLTFEERKKKERALVDAIQDQYVPPPAKEVLPESEPPSPVSSTMPLETVV